MRVLLDDEQGLAANLISACDSAPETISQAVNDALAAMPKVEGSGASGLYLTGETARVFDMAEKMAAKAGDSYVTV